ncbi:MAG: hemolysin III family protein [Treponema sp.]|nr:hemolysin III family protein [Treponema sp.]
MADISAIITRKSLKAKQKAAIRTVKAQAKEKIEKLKRESFDGEDDDLALSREQKKRLRSERLAAGIAYSSKMPREYTVGEDIFNSISHGIGAGLSIAALVLLIIRALNHSVPSRAGLSVFACTVYASAYFIMYILSTLYHAMNPYGARRVFSILTHDAIYFLIGGTFTPFILLELGGRPGWVLFAVLWLAVAALIALYSSLGKKIRAFSIAAYLVLGWFFILLFAAFGVGGLPRVSERLLLVGAAAYSFGGLFFLMPKYKWCHSVFHVFALLGSVLHFFAVWYLF